MKTRRTSVHQTGRTNKVIDKRIRAKAVGRRVTKWGTVYYEHRKNRTDIRRKSPPYL
jgi:hypothetical protein